MLVPILVLLRSDSFHCALFFRDFLMLCYSLHSLQTGLTLQSLLYHFSCRPSSCFAQPLGQRSRCSDWLWAGRPRCQSSSPSRVKNFFFSTSSRLALESTQPPIQWVPRVLSPGESGRGVKLTTHLQLVPRSRKCGSIYPLPHMS
jgi:hypothetical protein